MGQRGKPSDALAPCQGPWHSSIAGLWAYEKEVSAYAKSHSGTRDLKPLDHFTLTRVGLRERRLKSTY